MPETIAEKEAYIEEKMKQFKLVDMRNCYTDIIAEAEETSLGYMDFLIRLLSVEEEGKTARRVENLLEKANYGDNKKFSACQWVRGGGMSRWMEDV